MLMFLLRLVCAASVVLSAMAVPSASASGSTAGITAPSAADEATAPARIVLYGDSLTMGFSGDWTWRYRLARTLADAGTPFDLVGPRTDMLGYVSRRQFSQAYRDPEFDRDHASYAGMTFTKPLWTVSALANYYRPDVVVGLIGFNDIFGRLRTPAQLVDMWRLQISRARYWRPDISFVLVQQPDIWWRAMRVYNAGLSALARELDTPQSRVVITASAKLAPETDTYDSAHPSAAGERKIADTVAESLASIGIGTGPSVGVDTVDDPTSTSWAPTPTLEVVDGTLTVSWAPVDYASTQDIYLDDITSGLPAESAAPTRVTGTTWSTLVQPGHTYRVYLAPVKGYLPLGTRSESVTVEAPLPLDPLPQPDPELVPLL